MKILITGIGGDIGFNLGKILRNSQYSPYLIGSDIHKQLSGEDIFDEVIQLPSCKEERYFESLSCYIRNNSIDIFIPASEPELRYFSKNTEERTELDCQLIAANTKSMKVGFDKYITSKSFPI